MATADDPIIAGKMNATPKDSSRNNFPFYGIGLRGRLAA
jgi:hypothetical protein